MLGKTPRRIGALAAMGLVVAGIVATTGSPSGATEPPAATPSAVNGTLTLNLFSDRTGVVKLVFNGVDGSETLTQRITSGSACPRLNIEPVMRGTTIVSTKTLLDLTPIVSDGTGTVQLPGDFMGVNSGTSCGGPAGQIGPGEQLKIKLGTYFDPAVVKAISAKLAIRKTNRADGELKLQFVTVVDPDPSSDPVVVDVVDAVRQVPIPSNGVNTVDSTNMGSTSAVLPVPIAVAPVAGFYGVVLASTSESNSRGLSVATATSFTLSGLVSNTVFDTSCGDRIVVDDPPPGAIANRVEFFRGENDTNKDPLACSDVQATVEIRAANSTTGAQAAVFWDNTNVGVGIVGVTPGAGVAQGVRGTVTIDWAPVAQPATFARQIDYDGDGPGGFTASLWCVSFASTTDTLTGKVTLNGVLPKYPGLEASTIPLPNRPSPTAFPGAVFVDGFWRVPWCLVSDSRVLQGDGKIKQTEVLFGSGDPLRK